MFFFNFLFLEFLWEICKSSVNNFRQHASENLRMKIRLGLRNFYIPSHPDACCAALALLRHPIARARGSSPALLDQLAVVVERIRCPSGPDGSTDESLWCLYPG